MLSKRFGWVGLVVAGACALATSAEATIVGGGGSKKTDCLGVFETPVALPENKRKIVCVDGDASCDADLTVDGKCSFDISVCINSIFNPVCTLTGVESIFVEHSADNGDPDFDPDFQAIQNRIDSELGLPNAAADCTGVVTMTVPVQGPFPGNRCRSGKKKLRMTTTSEFDISASKTWIDKDAMNFVCKPAVGGCDPQTLFESTYDRIQSQIYDQSCAVSACHDSQTTAGNLLLETGSSYTSTVGVAPSNFAADQLGWLRVAAGDENASYLYQKVQGGLEPALGERMPYRRGKLKSFLRDIIARWIANGAPPTGWVPGTY